MAKGIFTIKKGFNDLENTYGVFAIQFGDKKFTLKNFRLQIGHDDSLPYAAILCVNNKPICQCLNDGWGGETELTPVGKTTYDDIKQLQDEVKECKWGCGKHHDFDITLDFIADIIACNEAA